MPWSKIFYLLKLVYFDNLKLILILINEVKIMTNTFKIDKINSDEEYLFIDIPNADKTVVIKRDDEGIVLDVFPMSKVVDEPITSTWCLDTEGY